MGAVSRYLDGVRRLVSCEVDERLTRLERAREALDVAIERNEEAAQVALEHLARKRLLASNTLRASNERDRLAWDDANRWVHDLVQETPPPAWSIKELRRLNEIVTGSEGRVRVTPIYSCGLEYMSPEAVPEELRNLELHTTTWGRHWALIAATTYISVVTIHPFDNGNGRTARLAADRLLLGAGYLPLCFLSPITSHVAQMQGGPVRDPARAVNLVLEAVLQSYETVRRRLSGDE